MAAISSCRTRHGFAQPRAGSADQISTCWSVTMIAMTVFPLSWPSPRLDLAAAWPEIAAVGYRLRGRPMAAL